MSDISGNVSKILRLTGSIKGSDSLSGDIFVIGHLEGSMDNISELDGFMNSTQKIKGFIKRAGYLTGSMAAPGHLIGSVASAMSHSGVEIYGGPYEATPTAEEQIFPTKFKKMIDDFTVDATPISDVRTVDTGGYTITVL